MCGVSLLAGSIFPHAEPPPRTWDDQADYSIPTLTPIPLFETVGDVLGPAFKLYFKNLWLITKIVFVVVAPFEVFNALSLNQGLHGDWQLTLGTSALDFICKVLIAPALIYSLMKLLQTGTAAGVAESYRWGLGKLVTQGLSVIIASVLIGLGTLFFVVPGIILAVAFYLIYPVAVLEQHSASETLSRSYQLTKGFRWKILGAAFVVWLLTMGVGLAVNAIPVFFLAHGMQFLPVNTVTAAIIVDILEQLTTVLSLVIYISILRTLESGRTQY